MQDNQHNDRTSQEAEHLSAFMDDGLDGLDAQRISDRLLTDDALGARWAQWHLIGDVMRSDSLSQERLTADNIKERLKAEPIHFPAPEPAVLPSDAAVSERLVRRRRPRLMYAGAAAAAVAFVALVSLAPQMQSVITPAILANSQPAKPISPTQLEDPRLRELMDRHGSMAIRPVSDTR